MEDDLDLSNKEANAVSTLVWPRSQDPIFEGGGPYQNVKFKFIFWIK